MFLVLGKLNFMNKVKYYNHSNYLYTNFYFSFCKTVQNETLIWKKFTVTDIHAVKTSKLVRNRDTFFCRHLCDGANFCPNANGTNVTDFDQIDSVHKRIGYVICFNSNFNLSQSSNANNLIFPKQLFDGICFIPYEYGNLERLTWITEFNSTSYEVLENPKHLKVSWESVAANLTNVVVTKKGPFNQYIGRIRNDISGHSIGTLTTFRSNSTFHSFFRMGLQDIVAYAEVLTISKEPIKP